MSEEDEIYEAVREHLMEALEKEIQDTFTNSHEEYEDGLIEGLRVAIRIVNDYFKTE